MTPVHMLLFKVDGHTYRYFFDNVNKLLDDLDDKGLLRDVEHLLDESLRRTDGH